MKVNRQDSGGGRRAAAAVTAVTAAVLGWASLSWACGLYTDSPTAAASPNRTPAASEVTVTGTGWQADASVTLSLSTDGSTTVQPLGTVAASADGRFSTRVRLADTESGVYYVSAVQGSAHTNIPIEVTGPGRVLANDRWNGLAPGSESPSLTNLGRDNPAGPGFPWAPVLLAGAIIALCGVLGGAEIRRHRATS
jgi:hypothetical protein